MRSIRFRTACGSFGAFERHFNVNDALSGGAALTSGLKEDPDGGATYSFDWGRVHFAVLNTNDNQHAQHSALSPAQLEWLKKDVRTSRERGAQWVILALHKGIYSKGYHSLEDADIRRVRQALTALIDDPSDRCGASGTRPCLFAYQGA